MITGPCVFQPAGSNPENNKLDPGWGDAGVCPQFKEKRGGTKENISLMGV